jgi:hypothetical protein
MLIIYSKDLVNDTYACENDRTLNGIMKGEFGFQGYVMSDWSAQHSTMSAVAGLDVCITVHLCINCLCSSFWEQMTMPGDITFGSGTSWFGQNLTDFVNNGTIAASRVDDMATRILAGWYLLHQDSNYPPGKNRFELLQIAQSNFDLQSASTPSSLSTKPQTSTLTFRMTTIRLSVRLVPQAPFFSRTKVLYL